MNLDSESFTGEMFHLFSTQRKVVQLIVCDKLALTKQ